MWSVPFSLLALDVTVFPSQNPSSELGAAAWEGGEVWPGEIQDSNGQRVAGTLLWQLPGAAGGCRV